MPDSIQRPVQGLSVNVTGLLGVLKRLWKIPAVRWAVSRGIEYGMKKIIQSIRKKRDAGKAETGPLPKTPFDK